MFLIVTNSKFGFQKGSASILFAAFLLPLMLLIGSIILDIEGYSQRRLLLQSVTDEAALTGVRYLPNQQMAKIAVEAIFSQKAEAVSIEIVTTGDILEVKALSSFIPFIASFFAGNSSNPENLFNIPVAAFASSTVSPVDVYIAVDRGSSAAPFFNAGLEERFGNPGDYPVPPYFYDVSGFLFNGNPILPEIVTEQCFNPKLSSVKTLAIRAIDFIAGTAVNRLAVSFFPGAVNPTGINSRLDDIEKNIPPSLLDKHINSDNGKLVWVEESENQPYFPVKSRDCYEAYKDSLSPYSYKLPSSPSFNEESLTLNLQEVVWSRVANHQAIFDSEAMLVDLQMQFNVPSAASRGGLINSVHQVALIFSTEMPRVDGNLLTSVGDYTWSRLAAQLTQIRENKNQLKIPLKLYYFIYQGGSNAVSLLQELFNEYRLTDSNGKDLFVATAINVESLDLALNETIPLIVKGVQRGIIKK